MLHIFFNMLGLFFLGPTLERHWGSRRFLPFYLGCGVAGALFYFFLVAVGFLPAGVMVGASGSILGMLAACAILFPHFIVFIFIFPVPIRIAAIGLTGVYFLYVVTKGANAGGHAAHLAGMAAGAAYVFSQSWRDKFKFKLQSGHFEKQMASQRNLQVELDRILEKVHNSGIQSLNSKEKNILKEATKAEQMRNKF
jgi:membrane associated rhomboid family serine protease